MPVLQCRKFLQYLQTAYNYLGSPYLNVAEGDHIES